LIAFAGKRSEAEWQMISPSEKRVNLIQTKVSGKAIEEITWDMVDKMNFELDNTHTKYLQSETVELLKKNSSFAANSVCFLCDEQIDYAAQISLNWDAPLPTQYSIEEHPISHSYTYLASIRGIFNSTH